MTEYGFASSVATDLIERARAYSAANLSTWAEWVEPRVALIQDVAVMLAGRGDRDDLIAALATAEGGKWRPARRVERLLSDEILVTPEPSAPGLATEDAKRCQAATAALPSGQKLLYRLLVAYMFDLIENARQIRDRAAAELAASQPDAQIEDLTLRVATAEQEAARASVEAHRAHSAEEELMRQNGLMRAELRYHAERAGADTPDDYVNAVLAGLANDAHGQVPSAESGAPEPDAPLPQGIRQRENGRFHAYLTRAETDDGKQRGVGTFATLEDAIAAREAALATVPEVIAA